MVFAALTDILETLADWHWQDYLLFPWHRSSVNLYSQGVSSLPVYYGCAGYHCLLILGERAYIFVHIICLVHFTMRVVRPESP